MSRPPERYLLQSYYYQALLRCWATFVAAPWSVAPVSAEYCWPAGHLPPPSGHIATGGLDAERPGGGNGESGDGGDDDMG